MPANYAIEIDLEAPLLDAISRRHIAEWSGLSNDQHAEYSGAITVIAEHLEVITAWPSEIQLEIAFGMAFMPYAELVRRDVESFLSNGTIPMKSLAEWGDI